MGAPRAAAVLVGLGLVATAATAAAAQTAAPFAELERAPVAARGAGAPGGPPVELNLPPVPEVEVAVEPAPPPPGPDRKAADLQDLDLHLPEPPEAAVTLTAQEILASALAVRLNDPPASVVGRLPRKDREAMAAFYTARAFRPVWLAEGAWTPAAQAVMSRLKAADQDGLDPADYPVPGADLSGVPPRELADAELSLSTAAILYAREARGARIEPSRLSDLITPHLSLPGADEVLSRLAGAADPAAALAAYQPAHPGYRALKAKLAEIRAARAGAPLRLPPGPALRTGMRDARVPLLRTRFGLSATAEPTAYDGRVAAAVAAFQRQQGLPASGVLTLQTVAALANPTPARLEGDIVANMERWRWLPVDLGERYITVNIPEFRLRVMNRGGVIHQARVIVGRPETPTPIFSNAMDHLIVNPSWTIPPSILKNEILPAMAQDPLYAERKGYQVIRKGGRIQVRQPPGEHNALGSIKFMFPNQYAVYLHDTPTRNLFTADRRAFSHGCVRVDQPFSLAEQVLGPESGWPESRVRSLVGKGERYIRLRTPLPIHFTYFTVVVDDHGDLKTFDDIYSFNQRVRTALGIDTATASTGRPIHRPAAAANAHDKARPAKS